MTVLRSRKVVSTVKSPVLQKKLKTEVVDPSTPTKSVDRPSDLPVDASCTPHEGSSSSRKRSAPPSVVRRRSLRLASKSGSSGIGGVTGNCIQEGSNVNADIISASRGHDLGSSLSGDGIENEETLLKSQHMEVDTVGYGAQRQGDTEKRRLSLRTRRKTVEGEIKVENVSFSGGVDGDHKLFPGKESEGVRNDESSVADVLETSVLNASRDGNGNLKSERLTIVEKGKGKVTHRPWLIPSTSAKFEVYPSTNETSDIAGVNSMRRLSREEKGKGAMTSNNLSMDSLLNVETSHTVECKETHGVQEWGSNMNVTHPIWNLRKQQFKELAKQSASRFALFSSREEENVGIDMAVSESQPMEDVEDWPGPFSTAMKIIQDREKVKNIVTQKGSTTKSKAEALKWSPKSGLHSNQRGMIAPSLQDLCMAILVKNADAVTSLDCIPDVIKHKLCHILCDSRKMNNHFLGLLTCGFPTEIRLRDCSWLTEEDFIKFFEGCQTSNLTVLQLDQCGRCLPDFTLLATLARLPNTLSALTTLSVKGACRLSDTGLSALVSSAPSLRSINLSQCSLLSSDGIKCLSESLGSVLKELYLDDCQAIDSVLLLPSLLKLEHLEVLSVAGIHTVCDEFVIEFVSQRGHNMRELTLNDCMKLTDRSLKAVAESCPALCAIDLSNLCKLTDYSLGFLVNGCIALDKLMLCRNAFSDEAIAAYLETFGNSMKELSLNNISKVSHNTAMALAKRCKNLRSLDVSWCRNLTDEALGLIADHCLSLEVLKCFGCTQVTNVFLEGHSNPQVKIIGLKMTLVLEHLKAPDFLQGPLLYSSA
ncbi:hypothetical protein DM860_004009 [Cuscuta australis]|uniref:Uncharacterized protein n=1 Tax=Cuscuta australis TaxID=267555 RepID=A0A328CUZ7_9ASTE|nr:hypothetical protein DM860_004009 [Cuscuta australis]